MFSVAVIYLLFTTASAGRSILSGTPEDTVRSSQFRKLQQSSTLYSISSGCVIEYETNYAGNVLVLGVNNSQPTATACCQSCDNFNGCNAWVWCGLANGCNDGYGTIYPYQVCALKNQTEINLGQQPALYGTRGTSDFTSGAPINSSVINAPGIVSFQSILGIDLKNIHDYSCSGSAESGYCVLTGDPVSLGRRCLADSECYAFSYFPGNSTAVFKGGVGMTTARMDAAIGSAVGNPNSLVYFRASS